MGWSVVWLEHVKEPKEEMVIRSTGKDRKDRKHERV